MHACPAASYPPLTLRSDKGTANTVDPTLDRAPDTHHCWVDRGSVDSRLTQGFAQSTGAVGIEPQTLVSLVQRLNRSATLSTTINIYCRILV